MLDFLHRMPLPQSYGFSICRTEMFGMGKEFVREDGCEMFQRASDGQLHQRRQALRHGDQPGHAGIDGGQIVAGAAVESEMLAAVVHFLLNEVANRFG